MPQWVWVIVGVALLAGLFALLLTLQNRIEPNDRDIENDEWLRKGGE